MKTLQHWMGSLLLSTCAAMPVWATDVGDVAEEKLQTYRQAIKGFAGGLKAELKAGMKEGGPVKAIGICNTKATMVAAEHSKNSGFNISRTSLKTRNSHNAPDDWEKAVLLQFEERKAKGEDPMTLEYAKIVEDKDGSRNIRYMKAIPTGKVCLVCHASTEHLDAGVVERLDKLYPEDQARGFKVGDLRGAFSVQETLKTSDLITR